MFIVANSRGEKLACGIDYYLFPFGYRYVSRGSRYGRWCVWMMTHEPVVLRLFGIQKSGAGADSFWVRRWVQIIQLVTLISVTMWRDLVSSPLGIAYLHNDQLHPSCISTRSERSSLALSTIKFLKCEIRSGKVRLAKWFTTMAPKAKAKIVKDVTQLVLARRTRMCNFLEYKGRHTSSIPAWNRD